MNFLKRTISVLTAAVFALSGIFVYAAKPSEWAEDAVKKAEQYQITDENTTIYNYTAPITRGELCKIILKIYNLLSEEEYSAQEKSPFLDTKSEEVTALYELGIVSGLGNGLFEPERGVTRQEISKLFSLVYFCTSGEKSIIEDEENLKKFTDFDEIGEWAYPYIAFLLEKNILNGYEDGSFKPQDNVTVEQTLAIAVRIFEDAQNIKNSEISKDNDENENLENTGNIKPCEVEIISKTENGISVSASGRKATISFGDNQDYKIVVTEQRNSYYENAIEARTCIEDTASGEYSFEINPVRIYRISAEGGGKKGYAEFITNYVFNEENRKEVDAYGEITDEESAKLLQREIEIPVWRISNGERVSGTARVTVHTAIADKVQTIFEEIYNGGEKFPIMDVGAYAWRAPMSSGRLSEHNLGTAIDINADQNYCLYSDGSAVGSHWSPYDDPYSITPYGEVINIFEKYGFTWGGDAWRSPNDYMHFSYLGT